MIPRPGSTLVEVSDKGKHPSYGSTSGAIRELPHGFKGRRMQPPQQILRQAASHRSHFLPAFPDWTSVPWSHLLPLLLLHHCCLVGLPALLQPLAQLVQLSLPVVHTSVWVHTLLGGAIVVLVIGAWCIGGDAALSGAWCRL